MEGAFLNFLPGYHSSVFQDFESYLRTEIDLVEDDIRLVLYKYKSGFITYELEPCIYNFEDLFQALFNILQPEYPQSNSESVIDFDDITKKAKLVVRSRNIAIKFINKSFFSTVLGFCWGWDYKHYIGYMSQKIVHLRTTNKIHLKCDVIDG